ncbi:hypothetical protein Shyhy01_25210 [Streptomyces hygroscopicus subsp. hygroscopicus]|nr:hypothetical protein [Streptomyces hygroscopicus]GLX49571.1 hypothetical protein Shyhy01_25210 [Streptomyces hygroscopicus subsp. hygroscopicus]
MARQDVIGRGSAPPRGVPEVVVAGVRPLAERRASLGPGAARAGLAPLAWHGAVEASGLPFVRGRRSRARFREAKAHRGEGR